MWKEHRGGGVGVEENGKGKEVVERANKDGMRG